MAAPAAVLSVLVRANTSQATSALARFNTQVGATEKRAGKMTGALKMVGKVGAVGVAAGLGFAVKKAADFEAQMSSLESVTDSNARQMGRFKKQALDAGAATKFSALDAAKAQTELAKGGLSVAQIMRGGLKSSLALAAAGEMDLADAAETTANAIKLFGLEGKDTMKVADALATAANATTADVTDFAMALKQGGGVAKMAGLSFTETVLALEALAETGVRNSDAGTSMKTAFIQLLKPSEKQAELAKSLGLNFVSASGGMKSMSDISAMLRSKLGGMTKAQRTAALATLAGTDGVRTLNALYAAGPEKLDKMKAGLDKSGTAAAVAAKKQDNLKGKVENLMGSIETLAIIVGSVLLPPLTDATVAVTKFLNSLSTGKGPAGELMGTLTSLSSSLGLSKEDWRAFGQAVQNVWTGISAVMSRVLPAIVQMVRGWATVIGGLLKVITGILTLDFGRAWDGVKQIFAGALGTIVGSLRMWTAPFRTAVVALANIIKVPLSAAWNAAKTVVTTALRAMVTVVRTFTAPHRAAIGALVNAMKGPFAAAWGAMRTVARGALAAILNLLRTFTAPHRAAARVLGAAIRTPIAAGFNAAKAVAGTVLRAIVAVVRAMAGPWRAAGGVLGAAIKGPVTTAMNVMKQTIGRVLGAIKTAFSVHAKGVLAVMGAMGGGIAAAAGAIRNIFHALAQVVRAVVGYITKAIDKLVGAIGKAKDKIGGLAPSLPNLPNIPSVPGITGQRGGKISGGKASGDSVPALLERGEYVLNRNAVRKVGARQLDAVNYGAAARFQKGGMVRVAGDPNLTGGRDKVNPSIANAVSGWVRRYHAEVGYAFDPGGGHVSPGHNVTGTATDVYPGPGGNWDMLEKGLRVLVRRGLKVLYGTNGVGMPWPNHGRNNHAHIEWGGAKGLGDLAAGAGGPGGTIPGIKVRGQGMLSGLAQGAADKMRTVANSYIARMVPTGAEGSEAGNPSGSKEAGALSKSAIAALWIRAGGPRNVANTMAAIALAESGGVPNKPNATGDGGMGLWQITPAQPGSDRAFPNAKQAVAKYKGSIAAGHSGFRPWVVWQTGAYKQFLEQGGLVQSLQKGAAVGGAGRGFPSAKEITGQEKRIESLKTKLGDKKDTKGYSWAKKRQGKTQKKLMGDLGRARSVLGSLKGRRKKGLGGRKKAGAKLSKQVEGFKLPGNTTKGIGAAQAHIQDLSDLYDQFEGDYNATTVTDAEGNEVALNQNELNDLVNRKTQIRNLIGGDPVGSGGQIAHLRDKVIPMVQERIKATAEFLAKNKKRVEKNMKKLRDYLARAARLRKSITTIDRTVAQIRKKKKLTEGDKKKLQTLGGKKQKLGETLNVITQRRIPALEADNALLTGDKRPKMPLNVAKMSAGEGLLPDAFAILGTGDSTTGGEGGIDLRGFMAEFQDKLRPGGLQAEWHGHDITIKALLKEGAEKPKAAAETGDTELAGLLRQQLQQANLRTAVSEAQFKVLRDAPPFAGSFATGGIVPGPTGAPRSAIVHGGEAIGQPGDVQVNISIAPGMEWLKQFIQVEIDGQTRKMSRGGRAALPGRGGGNLA